MILAHGIAAHLNSVRVVNQPVHGELLKAIPLLGFDSMP
jgi:hypothetical protein